MAPALSSTPVESTRGGTAPSGALWEPGIFLRHVMLPVLWLKDRAGSSSAHVGSSSSGGCYGSTRYLYEAT